jgi:hypothetical protein
VVRDDGAMYNLMSKCKISKDKMSKKNDWKCRIHLTHPDSRPPQG